MQLIKLLLVVLFISTAFGTNAQRVAKTTKAKSTTKTIAKYKPPVLITLLSQYQNPVQVNPAEAESLISMPIRVIDDKKVVYTISSYQFLYKKNVVTEDEQTGKVSPTTSIISDRFKTTPLPELWINKIREGIKKGEVLHYFDIIAKDPQGRVMYAPELKITVI